MFKLCISNMFYVQLNTDYRNILYATWSIILQLFTFSIIRSMTWTFCTAAVFGDLRVMALTVYYRNVNFLSWGVGTGSTSETWGLTLLPQLLGSMACLRQDSTLYVLWVYGKTYYLIFYEKTQSTHML